jgi:hypothetical protein
MMISSRWNYVASMFSALVCVICALAHDLRFLLINFFFAILNWYIAEWKRGLENEKNQDGESSNSSGSSKNDETEE